MSDSREGSGILGAAVAVCLLVIFGGGFLMYQRTQAQVQQALLAERYAREVAEHEAQTAQVMRMQAERAQLDASSAPQAQTSIRAKLDAQQKDWNSGDFEAFMQVYWKSEGLTFSSGGKVTRGWQATLDRYKARYPSAKERGKLTFGELEFEHLGPSAMLVLGTWHLDREQESIGGNFSLVWKRFGDDWLIVHDHTSALVPEKKE